MGPSHVRLRNSPPSSVTSFTINVRPPKSGPIQTKGAGQLMRNMKDDDLVEKYGDYRVFCSKDEVVVKATWVMV